MIDFTFLNFLQSDVDESFWKINILCYIHITPIKTTCNTKNPKMKSYTYIYLLFLNPLESYVY